MKAIKDMDALLIDDSDMIRQSSRLLMKKIGFSHDKIKLVGDASRAFMECRVTEFDLLIVDYNLGEGSTGLQMLERLNYAGLLQHDPIILIVTAESSAPVVRSFSEFDPSAFIVKPLRAEALYKVLKDCMAEQQYNFKVWDSYQRLGLPTALKVLKDAQSRKSYNLAITKLCESIYLQGEKVVAAKMLEKFIAVNSFVRAHLLYVDFMLTLDDLDEAQRILTPLVESYPRSLPVLELQCRMHLMQDDFIAAQSAIKALHELSPETLPRLYALIWLCTGLSPLLAGQSLAHYVQPFIRNSSHSVWEKSDRVAFITWVMMQQPEYAEQPIDALWGTLFKGKKLTATDASFKAGVLAWDIARHGDFSEAYRYHLESREEPSTLTCFESLFIQYHYLVSMGMWHEIPETLNRLENAAKSEYQPLLKLIKQKELTRLNAEWQNLQTEQKHNDLEINACANMSNDDLAKLWQQARFNEAVAMEIINRQSNAKLDNHWDAEFTAQAQLVLDALEIPLS